MQLHNSELFRHLHFDKTTSYKDAAEVYSICRNENLADEQKSRLIHTLQGHKELISNDQVRDYMLKLASPVLGAKSPLVNLLVENPSFAPTKIPSVPVALNQTNLSPAGDKNANYSEFPTVADFKMAEPKIGLLTHKPTSMTIALLHR